MREKRDEIDIDGVQDEFDGHENNDHVAASDYADGADDEKRKTKE